MDFLVILNMMTEQVLPKKIMIKSLFEERHLIVMVAIEEDEEEVFTEVQVDLEGEISIIGEVFKIIGVAEDHMGKSNIYFSADKFSCSIYPFLHQVNTS